MDKSFQGKTLYKNRKFILSLAWLQLVFSALLATTAIWGYVEYRATLGQFTQSVATAIVTTANVISQTAETVQTKQIILDDTLEMLISSRNLIEALKTSAQNQSALAPKYVDGIRGVSSLIITAGNALSSMGDGLMFAAPTSIQMEGIRPIIVMTRPLEKTGQSIKATALDLKATGDSVLAASTSLVKDAQNISAAFIDTSDHTIKILDDTEKTLAVLKLQELPKAVSELKAASDNLRTVSTQVDIAGNIGVILLIAGLLLACWCFLNSLSLLYLLNRIEPN